MSAISNNKKYYFQYFLIVVIIPAFEGICLINHYQMASIVSQIIVV